MDSASPRQNVSCLGNKTRSRARLNRYRELLIRKWWVPVIGVGLGLLVGLLMWAFQRSTFVSIGRMIVSIKLAIPEGSVYSEELVNFLGTQAALMQSRVVTERAQSRLALQNTNHSFEPVALRVNVSPKTSIFVLEASSPDAVHVRSFLQAAMEEYIKLKKEMRTQASDTTVSGLSEQALRLEKELHTCQEDLVQFQRTNGVLLLQERGNVAGSYLATLHQHLAAAKAETALLQGASPGEEAKPDTGADPVSRTDSIADATCSPRRLEGDTSNGEDWRTRQQLDLLKAEREDWARDLKPKHPRMVGLSEEIKRCERILAISRRQNADQLQNRRRALARQMAGLEQNIEEWNGKALETIRTAAEYEQLRANERRLQGLYDRLLSTLQNLDVNKDISPESVTLLEAASPPFSDFRKPLRQLISALVIGLVASIALVLLIDHVDDRINSFTELQEYFSLPVLVQIPRQLAARRGRGIRLVEENDPRKAFVEAYRSLRSSLVYLTREGPRPKTLVLTSSVPNEGKSITSANLAIVLAQGEARVLLVDADLRKGALHTHFGLGPHPGLYEVFSQQCHWENTVRVTRYQNLFLLGRGESRNVSSDLLLQETVARFLKEAAARYDYVVLDTPPVMAADDVLCLAPHADGVLFLVRAEYTSAHLACSALDLLYRRQVPVMGILFNAVRQSNADCYAYGNYSQWNGTLALTRTDPA